LRSETSANRRSDHAADNGSGGEFGKPMDRHRDGEPNVNRVNQSAEDNYNLIDLGIASHKNTPGVNTASRIFGAS
jgi:hypothetical protein